MRNRERISKTLDALQEGLFPFLEREMKTVYRDRWHDAAAESFRKGRSATQPAAGAVRWDAHSILTVMWDQWNNVFRNSLGQLERNFISELREFRNRWAHQAEFDFADTYRVLDSAQRLLAAAGSEHAASVARDKAELLRREYDREARAAYRRARQKRQIWQDVAIYMLCCSATVFAILQSFGWRAWFMALFVSAVFTYLVFQRLAAPAPVFSGAHECEGCGKIIYSELCPYCQPRSEPA
ncbi:MAG: hypothetical protein KY476_00860 [Planctomycetes bacterium]|nr:hypothetical protein [Planctomycetota bacterium]